MFKFLGATEPGKRAHSGLERKLELRKETLHALTPAELARVLGGVEPKTKDDCPCTTDYSNQCCGPNGSC